MTDVVRVRYFPGSFGQPAFTMANQVLNGPGELESQKECNAFTHEWEEEYYGYRCSNCLEFVDTDSWMAWMSGEEDEEWEFIPTDLEPLQ